MKLANLKVKVRCDFGLCKNLAKYEIYEDGVLSRRKIYLCEECAKALYELLSKEFVPKSPMNVINRSLKRQGEKLQ
ncbi:MAG: hypothetical protein K2L47_02445 [Clostridia bacterium]|nr:hypothetical protein [Clostridia bacterium]